MPAHHRHRANRQVLRVQISHPGNQAARVKPLIQVPTKATQAPQQADVQQASAIKAAPTRNVPPGRHRKFPAPLVTAVETTAPQPPHSPRLTPSRQQMIGHKIKTKASAMKLTSRKTTPATHRRQRAILKTAPKIVNVIPTTPAARHRHRPPTIIKVDTPPPPVHVLTAGAPHKRQLPPEKRLASWIDKWIRPSLATTA